MNVFDILEHAAEHFPAREAIRFQETSAVRILSYGELHGLALGFSSALLRSGVSKGDRVAVFLPNVLEYPVVTYGALRIGAVPVLLSSALKKEKVQEHVRNSQASVLVTADDLLAETALARESASLREVFVIGDAPAGARRFPDAFAGHAPPKQELASNDPAMILYTSGTTGEQKGAVLSHGNILSNIQATAHYTGMESQDRMMCFLPLFHCFGQNFVMNSTFRAGGTLVLHQRFMLEEILASLSRNRVTMFFSIPPNYRALLELPDISPFDSVRYFFTAADTMPPETGDQWQAKYGRQIWEGWGLTETSPFATYNHESRCRRGSVGTPIRDVEVRIANDEGKWLDPCEVGEVVVRGPNVFQGYFLEPAATKQVLRDGWFFTGDIGRLDEDGYLYIVDRKNDRIKVSGFSVWPREIEKFLRDSFGVRVKDVGIIGVPDPERGEMPFAYVVPGDPAPGDAEILEVCRRKLTGYQRLKGIQFVPHIPKTPTGKILKGELRKWQEVTSGQNRRAEYGPNQHKPP